MLYFVMGQSGARLAITNQLNKGDIMSDLNKLCHSLGNLEAQISALNDNLRDLRCSLTLITKRVCALERQYAFWNGKVAGIIAISSITIYWVNLFFNMH